MSNPRIHGIRRSIPASVVKQALGDRLSAIRQEDRRTWAEIGEVLGKSEDQAAKYADGSATMDIVSYTNARVEWNGRFTGDLDKLVNEAKSGVDPQSAQSCILRAALALSTALEDGNLTDAEIRSNRKTLEESKDAIEALLARLAPRSAA